MSAQKLIEQALRLPAADRAEVAAEILSHREEASRGTVVLRPWSDFRADLRKEFSPASAE